MFSFINSILGAESLKSRLNAKKENGNQEGQGDKIKGNEYDQSTKHE